MVANEDESGLVTAGRGLIDGSEIEVLRCWQLSDTSAGRVSMRMHVRVHFPGLALLPKGMRPSELACWTWWYGSLQSPCWSHDAGGMAAQGCFSFRSLTACRADDCLVRLHA